MLPKRKFPSLKEKFTEGEGVVSKATSEETKDGQEKVEPKKEKKEKKSK